MLVWHYTTGQKFPFIVGCGFLLPSGIAASPPEKPILWFSANQYWEQTACKAWSEPGQPLRILSMQETFKLGGGLVRFGCHVKHLRTGEALRKGARMKSAVWSQLAVQGLREGARPAEWWGRTKRLAIDELAVEVMTDEMKWEPVRSYSL